MDLSQKKLSLSEWNSIEVPVSDNEKDILNMIISGFHRPDIIVNNTQSLYSYVKIEKSQAMDFYLFHQYFYGEIRDMLAPPLLAVPSESSKKGKSVKFDKNIKNSQIHESHFAVLDAWIKTNASAATGKTKMIQPNKANLIRLQQTTKLVETQRSSIFEYVLLDLCKSAVRTNIPGFHLYSLIQLQTYSIESINSYVADFVRLIVAQFDLSAHTNKRAIFHNAHNYIEKNACLIKYEDRTLYSHQRSLFDIFGDRRSKSVPKLVLYMAPTGTGKTMSPLGLSESYRIIFVCVARHVGLALAKSAISVGKRIGFAFGCETASDIRLHNFAASEFIVNKRSGGIGKVDNSIGTKVEIMICDVGSYITAMHYMLAFNNKEDVITYWDEPTITMDYDSHDLHETIHRNWAENKIPNMVLSCATLPKLDEIGGVIADFKNRFQILCENEDAEEATKPQIHTIDSYDCKKSITLLNKDGFPTLPHLLFEKYRDVIRCVDNCEKNKTLLRYFDVEEIVRFIEVVQCGAGFIDSRFSVEKWFKTMTDITMKSLKLYYLEVLRNVNMEHWTTIHKHMISTLDRKFGLVEEGTATMMSATGSLSGKIRKIQSVDSAVSGSVVGSGGGGAPISRTISVGATVEVNVQKPTSQNNGGGILLTTKDAYTLTDGPTLFLAEDVDKIGKFYIHQAQIPEQVLHGIMEKIERNNQYQRRIEQVEKEMEDKRGFNAKEEGKEKKLEREAESKEMHRFVEELEQLRGQIMNVALSPVYVPNTKQHQDKWLFGYEKVAAAFSPRVEETDVREIMELGVDNNRKLLLILGIGVFGILKGEISDPSELKYIEVMKRLAYNQQLFLIIATSDYIYGTNYQFCHGFIGKDLADMTQQKIIQAIGRVGRNNIQQEYTVRFRDDAVLLKLFKPVNENKEAVVMNRLFGR